MKSLARWSSGRLGHLTSDAPHMAWGLKSLIAPIEGSLA